MREEDKKWLDSRFRHVHEKLDAMNKRIDEFEVTGRNHRNTLAALIRRFAEKLNVRDI